jgi:methanogenic corrinoid protein MtbC1
MTQQWGSDESLAAARPRAHPGLPVGKPMTQHRDDRRHDLLKRTVEAAVIPRLLLACRPAPAPVALNTPLPLPSDDDVTALIDLLLTENQPASTGFVDALRDVGISAESLYTDLLTPAARRLGVMWEEDVCDFADVTIAVGRLQRILRTLAPAFVGQIDPPRDAPLALLVQMPGEQHGLGLAMVAQYFARAGWNVLSEPVATRDELLALVRQESFAIVGISVSCSDRLEALAADIRAIRRASRNRAVGIMVGGPVFMEHPQLAAMVGADATASSGSEAVRQANQLVSLSAREL